jgi:alkanesulfonate monooxygenase SsuD/methylene tetrahydromethanopterin reductase-like flavin-dependent oxidoreductase (luciferase family)
VSRAPHDPRFGLFLIPNAAEYPDLLRQVAAAERGGLDLIGIQDHPYQRRYHDTWTLMSYLAGRTERIRFVTDVVNLPLRLPSVLAKSAASLDALSGGRFDLGIGAGSFWDAVAAMGGPKRSAKESVDALEEAIAIIRAFWAGEQPIRLDGEHYRVWGAKPGPVPEHGIGLWIGAYGPRMLRLTGRTGDGWLPSLGAHYLSDEDADRAQRVVDEAAREAGRDPAEIVRAANVMALDSDPGDWPDRLARVTELGFTTLLVGVPEDDPIGFVERLAQETGPRLRDLVG